MIEVFGKGGDADDGDAVDIDEKKGGSWRSWERWAWKMFLVMTIPMERLFICSCLMVLRLCIFLMSLFKPIA